MLVLTKAEEKFFNNYHITGIAFPCKPAGIKMLAKEMILLAFRDLSISEKSGRFSRSNGLYKKSAHVFLQSTWGELCADLADIENLKSIYEKNKDGIRLNHFAR